MLKSIGLQNFKSLVNLVPQDFDGVTLLCGNNSSGKSTLLQSILLLKQSLLHRDANALSFNGDFVRLGHFSHVVSGQNDKKKIKYCLLLDNEQVRSLELEYGICEVFNSQVCLNNIGATFTEGDFLRINFSHDLRSGNRITFRYDEVNQKKTYFSQPPCFTQNRPYLHPFGDYEQAVTLFRENYDQLGEGLVFDRLQKLQDVLICFENWLIEKLLYVGPIRQAPSRFYLVEEVPEIGPCGENTVPVLLRLTDKGAKVLHMNPGGERLSRVDIMKAVQVWFYHFGFIYHMEPSADDLQVMYKLGLKLPNFSARKSVALPDVGYGFSQMLPIVVQGLLAEEGDMILLEQPEIHLHPAVQSKIGDFFTMLARKGVKVLAETHSEHLLNRLRLNVAKDDSGELRNLVKILFVEQKDSSWQANMRLLELDEFGGVVDWPEGFFDSTEEELRELTNISLERMRRKFS